MGKEISYNLNKQKQQKSIGWFKSVLKRWLGYIFVINNGSKIQELNSGIDLYSTSPISGFMKWIYLLSCFTKRTQCTCPGSPSHLTIKNIVCEDKFNSIELFIFKISKLNSLAISGRNSNSNAPSVFLPLLKAFGQRLTISS